MAQEMTIRGTQAPVKVRGPWTVALLTIFTLGIYMLFWWYYINRELRDLGQAKGVDLGQNPTNSVLALFPGGIIIVPAVMTLVRGFQRVQEATRLAGREAPNGWIALLLYILISPAFVAYIQVSLNEVWEAEADGGAGAAADPAAPAQPAATDAPEPPAPEPPAPGPGAAP